MRIASVEPFLAWCISFVCQHPGWFGGTHRRKGTLQYDVSQTHDKGWCEDSKGIIDVDCMASPQSFRWHPEQVRSLDDITSRFGSVVRSTGMLRGPRTRL